MLEAGANLREKYRLEASIGRGGMGEVFSATHLGTGREVAIKVVHRVLCDEVLRARLHREAVAAGRIHSDFVPAVLDVDYTEESELFLVMERLHGESLSTRLRQRQVLPWEEVRRFGEDILRGLIDAHAAGVVHRDLKPGNVFIEVEATGRPERAKILDFGVCKLDTNDTEHLTATGESLGTVAYMAPEQIRGASKVDERADIYSFGMVVFEALSNCLPYDASGQMALIALKLEKPARVLTHYARVAIPVGLDALIAKALARKPSDRFATAAEVLHAWSALGPATQMPSPGEPAETMPTDTAMTAATLAVHASPGSRIGLVLAAFALLTGIVGIVVLLSTRQRSVASDPPSDTPISAPGPSDLTVPTASTEPAASQIELPSAPGAPVKAVRKAGKIPAPRSTKSAPKGSGNPHITLEPRY